MQTKILKNPFERKQRNAVATLCMLFFLSCSSENEVEQLLSDEQISSNFAKNGKIDPELLIGEWDAIAFAYTADGKNILNRTAILNGRLAIPNEPFIENVGDIENIMEDFERDSDFRWHFSCINWHGFFCLSSGGNVIKIIPRGSTYIYIKPPHLEYDLMSALAATYSFVVKNNELIFYLPTIEDNDLLSYFTVIEKNKTNLLIFKKSWHDERVTQRR